MINRNKLDEELTQTQIKLNKRKLESAAIDLDILQLKKRKLTLQCEVLENNKRYYCFSGAKSLLF